MKNGSISNRRWFLAAAFVLGMLVFTQYAFGEDGEEVQKYYGALSLITPFIAIVLSFITKQVVLSLAAAVFVGATIINGGNLFTGFLRMCDTYFVGTVADSWNASLMLFILAVGGMIAVMSRMGGMQAMAVALAKKAQGSKNVMVMTWVLGLIIFFEDIANSLIVGPTMRPVSDEAKVSREKLSYVIDSTAGPVTDMAPISSWVAHEIGMITLAFTSIGMEAANVYGIFLQTIPYRFYNIFAIAMVIIIVLMQRDYGPMYKAEKRARLTGKLYEDGAKPMMSKELDAMNVAEGAELRIRNAAIPILVFIVVTVAALWYTGGGMDAGFTLEGIATAFGNTDAASSILYSVIFTSILCIIMAVAQKIMTLKEAIDVWLSGCKELLFTVTILLLAWSTGSVMSDLGTGAYISGMVGGSIPVILLPMILFIISCFMAFSTGTSYGTSGIMIPIAFPIAVGMADGEVGTLAIVTIAAVTCGAIFGDHCSPISDTTIMSSMGSAADLMDHVKTQIPYAITVAIVAALGFILAAAGVSPLIILPLGVVLLIGIVRILGKSTKLEDLQKEVN
ncbi:Na+/H+ antiporter NhaC family protein [Ihubacter sp. mB4P-1]|uniref:Na+/H+ antiporter NhaC family protein n=1 Tax=Ihubacter sp. mB4P-1 TaxID=3242370 RepID=UPI003C7C9DD8